ncbi:MAG: hypothetical protein A3F73_06090 [Gallionellales bacterium RIFCSPLOWO2_12_FULL_59_22]|nr:MAG: hypothetical protein A3H99_03250 [Gallionellales bacterium RIFCSPLOWO2_02_FULL_59_110]OGT03671.1 MAG: hypothetical protein A2Z65_02415 [Gallionellales bacterium RIFCSPLOWO2_02_58_13]OGT11013.1 MAG: hypothetical protein A3F73_06090 [Gallionellales bacterium RIFCSPLOWO2_12_FULL_59_22]
MDMSSYEVERNEAAFDYGDEVLCAGWVPSLACLQPQAEEKVLPADLAMADIDAFLRKMYACQR